jgi:hypothetical protein
MSVLAGDVWRSGNVFQDMLLASRRYDDRQRPTVAGSRSDRDG